MKRTMRDKGSFWARMRRSATPASAAAPSTSPRNTAGAEPPNVLWPRVLQALAAAVAVGLFVAVALSYDVWSQRTRQFKVRGFVISGQQRSTVAEVQRASGLREGSPLFGVREADLAAAISRLPWVRSAVVHIRMPGTIEVTLREHEPAALLSDAGFWVLDADARVIKPLQPRDRVTLPVLTGVALSALLPPPPGLEDALRSLPWVGRHAGRRVVRERRAAAALARSRAQAMLRLYERAQGSDLAERFHIGELAWDDVTGASLIAEEDGAELRLGHCDADDLDRLLDQAARLLTTLERRDERLLYALLDDPVRRDRAVVATAPRNQAGITGGPVGGPSAPTPPRAAPAAR